MKMGRITKFRWYGEQVAQWAMRLMEPRLHAKAERIAADIRRELSTAWPPASAPGESPHRRSGHLVESIKTKMVFRGLHGPSAMVYTDSPYAPMLEFGTRRMAARPFFRKVIELHRPSFSKIRYLGRNR